MKKREKEKGENWIKTRVKHILCSLGEKLNSGGIRKYNVFALSSFLGNLNKSLWEEKELEKKSYITLFQIIQFP